MEADFLNAHDGTRKANFFVDGEHLLQFTAAVLLLLSGNFVVGSVHICAVVYNWRERILNTAKMESVTAFRELPRHKLKRAIKFAVYTVLFTLSLFFLVQSIAKRALSGAHHVQHHSDHQSTQHLLQLHAFIYMLFSFQKIMCMSHVVA